MNLSKTPVSILQEMMVKKCITPNYDLVHDGGGTHINTFTYRVSCDGLSATGTGRCKKDAKHEAAKAMLETIAQTRSLLPLPASPAPSPKRTPIQPVIPDPPRVLPNEPFVNAIGALHTVCSENDLNDPEYELVSEVGPPHAKVFTIKCKVTNFVETGVARTKKQAKQEAAKKMLDKLTDLVPTVNELDTLQIPEEHIHKSNELAKSRYATVSRAPTKKCCLGNKLSEYHVKLKNSLSIETRVRLIEKLKSVLPTNIADITITHQCVEEIVNKLEEILAMVDLEITFFNMRSLKPCDFIVGSRINASPDIVQISVGRTEAHAKFLTIMKSIETLITFLT